MKLLVLISMFALASFNFDEPQAEELRILFYKSADDKNAAEKFSRVLKNIDVSSSPLLVCHKGVAEMMQAKHTFNPFNKLARFYKGRSLIEQSIKLYPVNLEQRFLRFSIQSNLPGFLGYNNEIETDKMILLNGLDDLKDQKLKERIVTYMIGSAKLTTTELKKLR